MDHDDHTLLAIVLEKVRRIEDDVRTLFRGSYWLIGLVIGTVVLAVLYTVIKK